MGTKSMDNTGTVRSVVWAEQSKTSTDSKGVESLGQADPVRRITIPVTFTVAGKQGLRRSLFDRMVTAFEESGLHANQLSGKISIRSLKQLAHSVRISESVYIPLFTVEYPSFAAMCASVLGHFYKKPVVLHLVNQEYSRRTLANRLRLLIFKQLADTIIFTTSETNNSHTDKEMSVDFIAPVSAQALSEKSMQPRMAVLLEEESLPALIVVVKAFTAVKQKYPRAELVLLYDSNDKAAVSSVENYADTPGVILIESSSCSSYAEAPVSADMVLDFTAMSGDRTPLMAALSEGMSVISFQSQESEAIVTDGVEGIVTARLDRSFLAGRIIRMIEHQESATAMSREAVRLARRFSPSHFAQSLGNLISSVRA